MKFLSMSVIPDYNGYVAPFIFLVKNNNLHNSDGKWRSIELIYG